MCNVLDSFVILSLHSDCGHFLSIAVGLLIDCLIILQITAFIIAHLCHNYFIFVNNFKWTNGHLSGSQFADIFNVNKIEKRHKRMTQTKTKEKNKNKTMRKLLNRDSKWRTYCFPTIIFMLVNTSFINSNMMIVI